MIDVPYEISALSIGRIGESATIYVRSKLLDEKPCVFATYSNTDKALKVMEMLRSTYVNNEYYKSLCNGVAIPLPNNSDDMKEKMMATRAFRETTIFQFPKDEEVEV
jgi:hypothetical protein